MTTPLYEQVRQHIFDEGARSVVPESYEEGERRGIRRSLFIVYGSRFGAPPPEIAAAIDRAEDIIALLRWVSVVSTVSRDEVVAAMGVRG